jgi:hypothetical protein
VVRNSEVVFSILNNALALASVGRYGLYTMRNEGSVY